MKSPSKKSVARGGYGAGTLAEAGIDGACIPRRTKEESTLVPIKSHLRDSTICARMSRQPLVSLCKRLIAHINELEAKSK